MLFSRRKLQGPPKSKTLERNGISEKCSKRGVGDGDQKPKHPRKKVWLPTPMSKKEYIPKIVWVEWIDPEVISGWQCPEEIDLKPKPVEAIGYLLKEDNHGIAIAVAWDKHNQQANAVLTIPGELIIRCYEIDIPK